MAELRQIIESLGEEGQELGPLLKALRVTFERTAEIDERGLREFLQKEGLNVNLGTPREVKKKIKKLEEMNQRMEGIEKRMANLETIVLERESRVEFEKELQ